MRAGVLDLLGRTSQREPLLIVVDDAHWADQESLAALAFAARRLSHARVGFVFVVRAPDVGGLPPELAAMPVLSLQALDPDASAALLTELMTDLRDPLVRDAVLRTARGNPLALHEIVRMLATQLEDLGPGRPAGPPELVMERLLASGLLARPLPVGDAVARSVAGGLEVLPTASRTAVTVLAACHDPRREDAAAALSRMGLDRDALEPAEAVGLVDLDRHGWFRHPMVRSAVYHLAPAATRRRAHQALADAATDDELRAWHLAATASGPDDVLAETLAGAAAAAAARQAWGSALLGFRQAAALAVQAERRAEHLLAAARAALAGGAGVGALTGIELAEAAAAAATDPVARAQAHRILAMLWNTQGDALRGAELLRDEAAAVSDLDPELSVRLLMDATAPALHYGDYDLVEVVTSAAATAAERLLAANPGDPALTGLARDARVGQGWLRICRGTADPADPLGVPLADVLKRIPTGTGVLPYAVAILPVLGHYRAARDVTARIERDASVHPSGVLCFAQAVRADVDFRSGRWTAGYGAAVEAAQLAADLGHDNIRARVLTVLAQIDAARGDAQACREHAAAADELASRANLPSIELYAAAAVGAQAFTAGHHHEAVSVLTMVRKNLDGIGLVHPGMVRWAEDLIEALHHSGERDAARDLLDEFADRVHRTRYRAGRVAVLRARIVLGLVDEQLLVTANEVGSDPSVEAPYEQARLLLAVGEHLRLSGLREAARAPLRAGALVFTRLQARPWAARAGDALRAAGGVAVGSSGAEARALARLTPQELAVARLVSRGARNHEAAASLFLSTKTIESHLSSVYRKVGVRSRTELTARFAELG